MFQNVQKELNLATPKKNRSILLIKRVGYVAASLVVICSAALLFWTPWLSTDKETAETVRINDIAPGDSKAILTLADGSKVILDHATSGEIANQSGIRIIKTADGKVIYDVATDNSDHNVLFNKIETPRGGQYQVNLPDGSSVWLNAASSLRFPTNFRGKTREVELDGEAYFEIASDKDKPFIVTTATQEVEVLGTHFNINAYANEESVRTTLLEGSVKVIDRNNRREARLTPGQEAVHTPKDGFLLRTADIDQAISWKQGLFIFNDMNLKNIMRQLERWYNVNVDYTTIPNIKYNVHVSKDINLSEVLRALEVTGNVKFTIEDRTIKVSNPTN